MAVPWLVAGKVACFILFIDRQQDTFAKFKQPFPQIIQDLLT